MSAARTCNIPSFLSLHESSFLLSAFLVLGNCFLTDSLKNDILNRTISKSQETINMMLIRFNVFLFSPVDKLKYFTVREKNPKMESYFSIV